MKIKSLVLATSAAAVASAANLNPLDLRWTFGAHEPYTMYRRVGRHCTGGIDGNARWVKPWLDWFDSESPALMESLGLNGLHCRFYKGMGWEVEKKDFPNVKRFVENCHAHGVMALAYVQFATLYPEPMREEIPNIDDWAQIDLDGNKQTYSVASYFRWTPCIFNDEWVEYLKRMCTIALTEGGFDGIMFDNTSAHPCWCPRCERLFKEHMRSLPNTEERFGFSSFKHAALPRTRQFEPEVRDPVVQEWISWRVNRMNEVTRRLCDHIHRVKPVAVASCNAQPFRSSPLRVTSKLSDEMISFSKSFDLLIMQSENFPEILKDGEIVNRVRDLKMGQALGKTLVALCDSDAMVTEQRERHYMLPLVEDLAWGGVPTDRTIVSPYPAKGFVSKQKIERRRPKLAAFNDFVKRERASLGAQSWQPVRILYPSESLMFSDGMHLAIAAAEEICLRNQVPYGYLISTDAHPLDVPADCEVLVVPGITCLSDAQVEALVAYAEKGGRLLVTGDAGRYDEWNAQRLENPLLPRLKGLKNVVTREKVDLLPSARLGWKYRISPPKDGGREFMKALAETGWKPAVRIEGAPAHVFAEVKRTANGYVVQLVNYNPDLPVKGVRILCDGASSFRCEIPFDPPSGGSRTSAGACDLPQFSHYAFAAF